MPSDSFKLGMSAAVLHAARQMSTGSTPAPATQLPADLPTQVQGLVPRGLAGHGLPPRRKTQFDDLPPAALQLIAQKVERPVDTAALSQVSKPVHQLITREVQIAHLEKKAAAVDKVSDFISMLGKADSLVNEMPKTIHDLLPQERSAVLTALFHRIPDLHPKNFSWKIAFEAGLDAAKNLPQPLALLLEHIHGLKPEEKPEAFRQGLAAVETLQGDKSKPLLALLQQIGSFSQEQTAAPFNAGLTAVLKLPEAQQVQPLLALLRTFRCLPYSARSLIFARCHQAVTVLDLALQAPPLTELLKQVGSLKMAERQAAFETGLLDLKELPPTQQAPPLAALLGTVCNLPAAKSRAAFDLGLQAVWALPDAQQAQPLAALLKAIRFFPEDQKLEVLNAGLAAVGKLPAAQQAEQWFAVLEGHEHVDQSQKLEFFNAGFKAVSQLTDAAQQLQPMKLLLLQVTHMYGNQARPAVVKIRAAIANWSLEQQAQLQPQLKWMDQHPATQL